MPNYKDKKVAKKQHRCELIVENDCKIRRSEKPTRFLCVLNAGLATGLTEELPLKTATKYGKVVQAVLLPGKSFCFLEALEIQDAENICSNMHNIAQIGQSGAVTYLSFFESLPELAINVWKKPLPEGLHMIPDFINNSEEVEILNAIDVNTKTSDDPQTGEQLKHRRVKHFGYEFLYSINGVDPQKPLEQEIPEVCGMLWSRLKVEMKKRGIKFENWLDPDQLTVNCYEPGQGIPSHVDTHSQFMDPIISLSLLGDIVMDFRRGSERIPIFLPARSILVMSGESRYDWTHGITPRVLDVMPSDTGSLTTRVRTRRVSLTFRRLRKGPCVCRYPLLCDTRLQNKTAENGPRLADVATKLEELNVHSVYDNIASHFSETRHTPWPQVQQFLESFSTGSVLVDIGCGNGKYLFNQPYYLAIGCDRSQGLLDICVSQGKNTFRCDCLNVPLRCNSVDGCISIAVIHHLATPERRLQALLEMSRILRPHGRALVYVWAKEQQSASKKSSYLLQNKAVNKHKVTEEQLRQQTALECDASEATVSLPIHTNRTDFQHQDVLVPWKTKNKISATEGDKKTFLRYYHVFEQGELERLLEKVADVRLIRSYYDQGNHCVIFEKKE